MRKLFKIADWRPVSTANRSKCTVVFIAGGSRWALVRHFARQPNTIVVVIDNPEEQQQHAELHRQLGVHQFSVGDRHTLVTLFAGVTHPDEATVKSVASTDGQSGLAASPAAGFRAGELLAERPDFVAFLHSVVDEIIQMTNGKPEFLQIRFVGSYAGATAAGLFEPVDEALPKP